MNENLSTLRYQICTTWLARGTSEVDTDIPAWVSLIDLVKAIHFPTEKGEITLEVEWGTMKHRIQSEVELDDLFWKFVQDKTVEMVLKPPQADAKIQRGSIEGERRNTIASLQAYFRTQDEQHRFEAIKQIQRYWQTPKDDTGLYRINCTLIGKEFSERAPFGYLSILVHYIFLAMNFASPGSCNFYSTTMTAVEQSSQFGGSQREGVKEQQLSLSSDYWDSARLLHDNLQWPDLPLIPVSETWTWLQGTTFSMDRVAETHFERALFGLLHSFREDQAIIRLLWLTLALEALYDTPTEGIIRYLKARIFLFLGTPSTHAKKITKLINTFYNLRSRFVHGSSPIINPITYELYKYEDTPDDTARETVQEAADFATLLVIATLQKMVSHKWNRIVFSESFEGQA